MLTSIAKVLLPMALAAALPSIAAAQNTTIVLVHGAFADSSGWSGVIQRLQDAGFPVVAAANPLRSVGDDTASVAALLHTIDGPIVLVGHSYGGVLISNAARDNPSVKGLVFVAGFAPAEGESALQLTGQFPGSALGPSIVPAALGATGSDLYIRLESFAATFAADVDPAESARMAVTQRPVTDTALNDPSGPPAWVTVPSWFIYGDADLCIPPAALSFMADRAKSMGTTVVPGGSHALMVSHPDEVAAVIEAAAAAAEVQ
jgi:pimeloyl-ACP methyl ester carboxylesterase